MRTVFSHLTNDELLSKAYGVVSPDDEMAFELLMRLEALTELYPETGVYAPERQEKEMPA